MPFIYNRLLTFVYYIVTAKRTDRALTAAIRDDQAGKEDDGHFDRWRSHTEKLSDPRCLSPRYILAEFRRVMGLPEVTWTRERQEEGRREKRATVSCGDFAVRSEWRASFGEAEENAAFEWLLAAYHRYGASPGDVEDLREAVARYEQLREDGEFKKTAQCPVCRKTGALAELSDHLESCWSQTCARAYEEGERAGEEERERLATQLVAERRIRRELEEQIARSTERRLQCPKCREEVRADEWDAHARRCEREAVGYIPTPDDLTCTICLELTKKGSMALACGHTLCLPCLTQWKSASGGWSSVRCPACRQATKNANIVKLF